jgi:hypothetical protein
MISPTPHALRKAACLKQLNSDPEKEIADRATGYMAKLYALYELQALAEEHPELIDTETVDTLKNFLRSPALAQMRQSLFLFREAADTLCAVISATYPSPLAHRALSGLRSILRHITGAAHRAAAEAMGALPFSLQPPQPPIVSLQATPLISWQALMIREGFQPSGQPVFAGRSLVTALRHSDNLLVLKMARIDDSPEALAGEILWMDHLRDDTYTFTQRFEVPEPVRVYGHPVFRITCLPKGTAHPAALHPRRYAVGYVAPREYFRYPNEPDENGLPATDDFSEILSRNAYLLGRLAGKGIFHEAPIPLFHNRVQQDRRRDQGRYEWFRAGRLDRWLDSCSYPNLGPTGLRDFEHLLVIGKGGKAVYRNIGTHLLSLLLVAGSYFRNRDRRQVGFDADGCPVDARHLFDREALCRMIVSVFRGYYHGFAGDRFTGELPLDLEALTDRMIAEMGIDRYMEELFRVVDQNRLSRRQFEQFLSQRGFPEEKIAGIEKGTADITIHSGPHLGAFNDQISLPELIAAVETMAAICVCGRHLREKAPVAAAA